MFMSLTRPERPGSTFLSIQVSIHEALWIDMHEDL